MSDGKMVQTGFDGGRGQSTETYEHPQHGLLTIKRHELRRGGVATVHVKKNIPVEDSKRLGREKFRGTPTAARAFVQKEFGLDAKSIRQKEMHPAERSVFRGMSLSPAQKAERSTAGKDSAVKRKGHPILGKH